ncbi:hypothetical protein POVCU2_0044590 [Plasmodium ovale curtisi]|uniref:Uncharacterized protein n=1 Tax=Plasmodium ovale curtisi TaxID=864141 RepID=A0A1A8W4V1_PLAOA|nr:hypothetical protein POVCU2_0044590 [Plasmodium ovale curtisi]SBS97819.1 hypothetical protein POVCU1_041250 [Plasmodium ovale curtisi]
MDDTLVRVKFVSSFGACTAMVDVRSAIFEHVEGGHRVQPVINERKNKIKKGKEVKFKKVEGKKSYPILAF